MYEAIKRWQESGLTQVKFCIQENLSAKSFCYWLRKYRSENPVPVTNNETFIPVSVPGIGIGSVGPGLATGERIELFFPNGVRLNCPAGIEIKQLKTLINI